MSRRATFAMAAWAAGAALAVSGCAKARAETPPDGPPLAMPLPPPRVLVPAEEPLVAGPVVPEVPVATAPSAPVRPPIRRPAPVADNEPRETASPAVAETPPVPAGPAEPARELRAAPAAADAAAERQVRDLLARASRALGRTDYRKLNAEGRVQYDQSKRFSEQAEQALKERNFVFAATLADKAATLADALVGG
jgi:hypothetical protein